MKANQVLFALAVSTILLTSCNSREDVTHMSQDQMTEYVMEAIDEPITFVSAKGNAEDPVVTYVYKLDERDITFEATSVITALGVDGSRFGNYDEEMQYFPVKVPKLEKVNGEGKYYRIQEARDEYGYIVYEDKKDSDGNIVYQKEIIAGQRKHLKEISRLRPLLNILKNPCFLIPLLYFANSELIKRLEYKNKNKKVSVLPKALAIRDLILSASITKEME